METITIEIDDQHAMAAAQFFKRLGFTEIRVNAENNDDAYLMKDALYIIQKALNEAGFDPR